VEVDHTVAKSSLVEQIKSGADLARKSLLPTSHHDRIEKQMTLVDQVGAKRECRELGTTNGQSPLADAFICRIISVSKVASILVLALDAISKVLEKTTFSAPRQISV
jgi:hypothetical protein